MTEPPLPPGVPPETLAVIRRGYQDALLAAATDDKRAAADAITALAQHSRGALGAAMLGWCRAVRPDLPPGEEGMFMPVIDGKPPAERCYLQLAAAAWNDDVAGFLGLWRAAWDGDLHVALDAALIGVRHAGLAIREAANNALTPPEQPREETS